ncbi:hypothetical protein ACH5RR_002004 [Cinchona calisaya]|uniref:Uncharacterized protein n=1 Tax=Cinchona calisaya TaxID=153742 RepID=A0ABD3B5W7_9GENT
MSLFHSSVEVICADYFGDELVFPLPKVNNKKMDVINNQSRRKDVAEVPEVIKSSAAAAEELVGKKTAAKVPQNNNKPSLRFSPAFDVLHCFETMILN